jgi:hypothetical protein
MLTFLAGAIVGCGVLLAYQFFTRLVWAFLNTTVYATTEPDSEATPK